MAVLMEGKIVAEKIRGELKKDMAKLKAESRRAPKLCTISIGSSAAGQVYLKSQSRACSDIGIEHSILTLDPGIRQDELVAAIGELNRDPQVTGIMIQSPLPGDLNMEKAVFSIAPAKDAEGLHPENLGKLVLGHPRVVPCTAQACLELLHHYHVKLYGKEAVIVGHSVLVGKPLSLLLLKEFATTTVCHIATSEAEKLRDHVITADILVVAVGKANLIPGSWIKPGAVVIDVGINKSGEGLVGDVEFTEAGKKASHITPVPGGVGPLTVTILLKNICELFKESVRKG